MLRFKNLDLMSKSFPEYTGKVRSGHTNAEANIEELMSEQIKGITTEETREYIVPHVQDGDASDTDNEVKVKQDENSVEIEYTDDLDEEQMIVAEAYSLLYSLGGYTYDNLVKEGIMEAVSTVEEGKEEADDDDFDGDDNAVSSSEVNEEELIKTKTPYEQKFFLGNSGLFLANPLTLRDS